tara:strand:- start:1982 stop:2632 length:651 start_codon:yes stop_codon:yes gene_type:complete
MAENKKGFVLYADQKSIFDSLTNEESGVLIKHIFSYVNDENPTLNDRLIDMAFNPIKLQLKRDLVKYEGVKERNSANARKRWDATASSGIPKSTKNADKGIDKDKDKDKGIDTDIIYYRKFKHLKITSDEVGKLLKIGYEMSQIDTILDSIENYANNKNYTSLYLTSVKWLKKEFPAIQRDEKCPYTESQIRGVKAQKAAGMGLPEWFNKKWEHLC